MRAVSTPVTEALQDMRYLRVDDRDGVLWVRFDRPDKLNAMCRPMLDEIIRTFDTISTDSDVRAVVVTGIGRAFMAGADIVDYADGDRQAFVEFQRHGARAYAAIRSCPAVVIAAVNGFALGGGLEMVLSTDVVIAAESARLGLPEIKLGLLPGGGGTAYLRTVLPAAVLKDLLLSGRAMTAEEAWQRGIVSRVVADGDLADTAAAYARKLSGYSGAALAEIKALVDPRGAGDIGTMLQDEHQALVRLFDGPDGREGIAAFVHKREPRFNQPASDPAVPGAHPGDRDST